ncbi:B3 domain-containing protein REM7-like isoform X2 [Brassica napus]|uniref:B3 domain-containing protein REM7-like isoform X2 n=1 Tax=Brassica napus TaxID=3708 RepID=UPI0020788467|nr:B3 domain-containing protein REM7-like isoform X2 [Brassica napus]
MNHWAVQPNAFAAGGDLRNSVSVVERDQTVVVCPKPRRIGLRNPLHHPSRSLRCYSHQVESKAETDILDIILTKMETPREPHFFKPLLPGFHSGVAIPLDFYSKHIQGAEINKPWKLRSDASDQIWEVIREGRTLTKGWKEFTEAHDLRIGDIVIFKHEGDMVFHVTPFGPSCCEILWSDADDAPTFSYDYCFLAEVTPTNQKDDKMFLPVEAMRCGALNQQCKEVKLVNKDGKSWTARFGFSESDGAYYISRGWRKFCRDNKCTNGDLFVFNVVGDGTTTPLLCVCPERKECTELLIKHFSRIDGSIASTSRN